MKAFGAANSIGLDAARHQVFVTAKQNQLSNQADFLRPKVMFNMPPKLLMNSPDTLGQLGVAGG